MNGSTFVDEFFSRPDFRMGRFKHGRSYSKMEMDNEMLYSFGHHFPLLVETYFDQYILNGDRYSSTTSGHQNLVRHCVPSDKVFAEIPYSALDMLFRDEGRQGSWSMRGVGLIARQVKIIDTVEASYRTIKYLDPVTGEEKERDEHLLGAALIRYNGRCLLSSADTGGRWGHGYFLTELPEPCERVDHAFEMLKPIEVVQAEEDEKRVERQGEWFFVEVGVTPKIRKLLRPIAVENNWLKPVDVCQMRLPGMPVKKRTFSMSRFVDRMQCLPPHRTQTVGHHIPTEQIRMPNGLIFVRGFVRHEDREHAMVKLGYKTWWRAIPNMQVQSWSVQGRVD